MEKGEIMARITRKNVKKAGSLHALYLQRGKKPGASQRAKKIRERLLKYPVGPQEFTEKLKADRTKKDLAMQKIINTIDKK